jgi:diketogulonate reductase-like aldo/keto reductase
MYANEPLDHLKKDSQEKPLSRRDFMRVLTIASAAGPGLAVAALSGFSLTRAQRAEAAEMMVGALGKLPKAPYGTRMNHMMVTPICISSDWNHELYAPALAMGVNFVHKAHQWRTLPDEFAKLDRASYYTDITVDSTPDHPDDYDKAYNQVTTTLDRNGLKYYDIFRAHFGWRSLDAFKNQTGTYKAFQQLKKEGKVKYFAVSQHPYIPYPEIIQAEIDSGLIDSMQVWYSYSTSKEIQDVFAKASKAGIAMTAMKIYANGHDKMRGDAEKMKELKAGDQVGRAVIRQAMTAKRDDGKPIFCTCVSALGNMQVFEENVGAVSPTVSLQDGFHTQYAF